MKKMKRYEEGGEVIDRGPKADLGRMLTMGAIPALMESRQMDVLGGLIPQVLRSARKKGNPVSVSIEVEEEGDDMEAPEMMRKGGMSYAQGGSLKMVDKGGEKVPFFAADGKGKMMGGGMTYKKGGMSYAKGGMTKGGRDGCAIRGKTKGRMV